VISRLARPLLAAQLLGLSCLPAPAADQAKLDAALRAEMDRWHCPGAAVAVTRNGRVVLSKGYGVADQKRSIAVTPQTKFFIGSMSKQFTAAAVMLLNQDGRVALDTIAATYLPRLPASYRAITVRQLLTHTSGIQRDFTGEKGHSLVGADQYAALASAPPAFAPGDKAAYSNTNYILLGMLIEAVSGEPYGDFLAARIFAPLGMTATTYLAPGIRVAGLAMGYEWMDDAYQEIASVPGRFGAGGIVSTVTDLAKWDAALAGAKLLPRAALATLWTGARLNDGSPAVIGADDAGRLLEAGMGWFVSTHYGHRVVHHGGNIDGYSAQIDRFVDDHVTIIVLANNEAHAAINIARPVIEAYVPRLEYESGASLVQRGRLAFNDADYAGAAKLYVAALEKGESSPTNAFNAARCFALLGRTDDAFAYLDRAAALGYCDLERLRSETSLATIRDDPRWPRVVERVTANRAR